MRVTRREWLVQRILPRESQSIKQRREWAPFLLAFIAILVEAGCAGKAIVPPRPRPGVPEKVILRLRYSIQVGAFSHLDNAVRLNEYLERQGIHSYYFVHKTGLYKVRFGDFPSKEAARKKAESLRIAGIIQKYYIVTPEDYAAVAQRKHGTEHLRNSIVRTAKHYIGLSYRWGGSSAAYGFDCSGLTMAVYHYHGLNIPRSSREQYRAGNPVDVSDLLPGDLVFFTTSWGSKVSHVGIYAGDGRFTHAPGQGKRVRFDKLSKRYYQSRYAGARAYL